ncbi:MAG TPA: YcxB family protein, partial [Acidimicrobiales bacterium]|nr:YcxB family protein [Acidimicrobiales bacterium]
YRFTEEEYVSIARRVVFKLRQEGVRFLTPESDNWIRWRYLPTCVEVAGCYVLLLQGRRAAAYVPKKAFASEGDEQAVRALLAQHTTKRLRGWR